MITRPADMMCAQDSWRTLNLGDLRRPLATRVCGETCEKGTEREQEVALQQTEAVWGQKLSWIAVTGQDGVDGTSVV